MRHTYKLTYLKANGDEVGHFSFVAESLPSHDDILKMLNDRMPFRPPGGFYQMESQRGPMDPFEEATR